MAEWLKRSALTQRARVRSRAKKSFFYFVVKSDENFLHTHIFMRGTRWRCYSSMKTFGKIKKDIFRFFQKFSWKNNIAIVFPA
jgi:hypothetical protein